MGISNLLPSVAAAPPQGTLKPMALGLMIQPATGAEAAIARVKELGLPNCFLSLDGYLGKFSESLAKEIRALLEKYDVTQPVSRSWAPDGLCGIFSMDRRRLAWCHRKAGSQNRRVEADLGFCEAAGCCRACRRIAASFPRIPAILLYEETVLAIRELRMHCAANGQDFLMETGQETPTTMKRAFEDVNQPNLGVGLDTANLILYGKPIRLMLST